MRGPPSSRISRCTSAKNRLPNTKLACVVPAPSAAQSAVTNLWAIVPDRALHIMGMCQCWRDQNGGFVFGFPLSQPEKGILEQIKPVSLALGLAARPAGPETGKTCASDCTCSPKASTVALHPQQNSKSSLTTSPRKQIIPTGSACAGIFVCGPIRLRLPWQ